MQNANYVWKFIRENCYSFHICFVISSAAAIESSLVLRSFGVYYFSKKKKESVFFLAFATFCIVRFVPLSFFLSFFYIFYRSPRSTLVFDHNLMRISHTSMPQYRLPCAPFLRLQRNFYACCIYRRLAAICRTCHTGCSCLQ